MYFPATKQTQILARMQARSQNSRDFVLFKGEFLATGLESGTKFTSIDLGEGEWFEYDEKAGGEVSVRECRWEVARG